MNDTGHKPARAKPHSLGSTLFLGGGTLAIGIVLLATALRNLSENFLALAAGAVFLIVGLTVLVRDFAGAANNEDIPAGAPPLLRLADHALTIALVTAFAVLASAVAIGPLFAEEFFAKYEFSLSFRIFSGAFGLVLWYGAFYLALAKLKQDTR